MTTVDTYGLADYVARRHDWTVRGHKLATSHDIGPGWTDHGIYGEFAREVASTDGTRECKASVETVWHRTVWADGTVTFGHAFVEAFDFLDDELVRAPIHALTMAAALREAAAAIDHHLSRLAAKRDALPPLED